MSLAAKASGLFLPVRTLIPLFQNHELVSSNNMKPVNTWYQSAGVSGEAKLEPEQRHHLGRPRTFDDILMKGEAT
jgi:hypothetical protein